MSKTLRVFIEKTAGKYRLNYVMLHKTATTLGMIEEFLTKRDAAAAKKLVEEGIELGRKDEGRALVEFASKRGTL
jgi:hypothetical protein